MPVSLCNCLFIADLFTTQQEIHQEQALPPLTQLAVQKARHSMRRDDNSFVPCCYHVTITHPIASLAGKEE